MRDPLDSLSALAAQARCEPVPTVRVADRVVALLNAAAGLDYTEERFLRLGEAIWNLERLYNLAAGIDGREDRLPDICFERPADFPADAKLLTRDDLARLLRDYYAARGWDEQGRPTPERLTLLGLRA